MNCMLCTAIEMGNLSKREKEKALGDVLSADATITELQTAGVPPLRVREKASQKETANLKVKEKGKVKVRKMGERALRADASTVVVHTTHPIAQRARVKAKQVSSRISSNVANQANGINQGLTTQCLNH